MPMKLIVALVHSNMTEVFVYCFVQIHSLNLSLWIVYLSYRLMFHGAGLDTVPKFISIPFNSNSLMQPLFVASDLLPPSFLMVSYGFLSICKDSFIPMIQSGSLRDFVSD